MDKFRNSAKQFTRKESHFKGNRDRMADNNARKTGNSSSDSLSNWNQNVTDPEFRYTDATTKINSGKGKRAPTSFYKKQETPTTPAAPVNKYRSTVETPPSDELRYDISSLGVMTPQQDKFVFNHTADGFVNVVEQCYNKMVALDGRLTRKLPFCVFLHNMNQLYYVHLIKIAEVTGQQSVWPFKLPSDDFQRLVGADTVEIPEEIWFWLRGLGQWKDKTGLTWIPNYPYIMSPREARTQATTHIPGGDFGTVTAERHNVYENHMAPYTTRAFVTAMLLDQHAENVINYLPLPAILAPPNSQATSNFLGFYSNNRRLHSECLANYDQFNTHWAVGFGARIGYNSYLWTKMNAAIMLIKPKMKIKIGLPPTDLGSSALYGSIYYEGPNPTLRLENGVIESSCELDPQTLSITAINTYRRRRAEDSPGVCYTTAAGQVIAGWSATRNNEYDLVDPFHPQVGVVNLNLNEINFTREVTEGRYNIILDQITKLTLIQR